MHADKHRRRITETGTKDKTPIFGILERGGEVPAAVVPNRKKKALHGEIKKHVAAGSAIYSDALMSYQDLKPTLSPTKSLTMLSLTLMDRFTQTGSKTSGVCSSVESREPT
jgi:ISXO2-like transposase domain